MVRITEQNDWVIFLLVGCIFLYIFMLFSLQRESSLKEYLLHKFPDSTNNLLSWIISSVVYCLIFSAFISPYLPIVPKEISKVQLGGYEINKFGFAFLSISLFYFLKNILGYLFYAATGNVKKWELFSFTASKFYFCFSLVMMAFVVVNTILKVPRIESFDFFAGSFLFIFLFKLAYYIFHRSKILPEKWYYKILYICTLQIIPVLVLWKILFF